MLVDSNIIKPLRQVPGCNIDHKNKVETIIEQIKMRRSYLNYKQADIAEKLDISLNAYSKIERGITHLDLVKLFKLAQILQVDIKTLI